MKKTINIDLQNIDLVFRIWLSRVEDCYKNEVEKSMESFDKKYGLSETCKILEEKSALEGALKEAAGELPSWDRLKKTIDIDVEETLNLFSIWLSKVEDFYQDEIEAIIENIKKIYDLEGTANKIEGKTSLKGRFKKQFDLYEWELFVTLTIDPKKFFSAGNEKNILDDIGKLLDFYDGSGFHYLLLVNKSRFSENFHLHGVMCNVPNALFLKYELEFGFLNAGTIKSNADVLDYLSGHILPDAENLIFA